MTEEQLTLALADRILGWKAAPGRFLKPDRGWCPRWRFEPLVRVEDALDLANRAGWPYAIRRTTEATFEVELVVDDRMVQTSGPHLAIAISFALAHALRLELPGVSAQACVVGERLFPLVKGSK